MQDATKDNKTQHTADAEPKRQQNRADAKEATPQQQPGKQQHTCDQDARKGVTTPDEKED